MTINLAGWNKQGESVFSKEIIARLTATADKVVWATHHETKGSGGAKPREEHYVGNFVIEGPELLKAAWEPVLSPLGLSVSVAGAFCHGSPQVSWDVGWSKGRVELADLLLVVRTKLGGASDWMSRACLIQAKTSDDGQLDLGTPEPKNKNYEQLSLLTAWPPFEFISGDYKADVRNVGDIESGQAAYYSTIAKQPQWPEHLRDWLGMCPWAVPRSSHGAWPERSFGDLLANMVDGKVGRRLISSDTHDPTTWTGTVHELVEVLKSKVLKAGRYSASSRHNVAQFVATTPAPAYFGGGSGRNSPTDTSQISLDPDDSSGMSTLIVEIGPS